VIAQQQLGESQVNDGMDAAVLAIDLEARSLEFAGAHSSCYLMRKGQIQELKGSPCPVGGFQRGREARRYESHFVALEPNDILYACSDGFKDQFGGPHNRKLLGKTVRQWLEDMAQHPMTLQKELLWKSWLLWKGRQKQTDDVLLAGVKIGHEHFRKQA
jgi:serine phosphatase RsbU (regulator of sigma subunit)